MKIEIGQCKFLVENSKSITYIGNKLIKKLIFIGKQK